MENIQELNNDFITIWSKFLLEDNLSIIKDDIQCLAEMGVYEAIEKWYDLEPMSYNHKIQAVLNMSNDTTSYYLAYATKLYNENILQIDYWARELNDAYSQRGINCFSDYFTWDNKVKDLEFKLKNAPYITELMCAYNTSKQALKNSKKDIYTQQQYIDVLYKLGNFSKFSDDKKFFINNAHSLNNKLLRKLLKEYKKQIKHCQKPSREFMFVLSKALIYKGENKCKTLASELLTELSKQPLSQTLTNYKNEHINNIESKEKSL